jgi:hypothetical protein
VIHGDTRRFEVGAPRRFLGEMQEDRWNVQRDQDRHKKICDGRSRGDIGNVEKTHRDSKIREDPEEI